MAAPDPPVARTPAAWRGVQRLDALRVLSLRHLPGASLPELAGPGRFIGGGPRWLWRSPSEQLWIGDDTAHRPAAQAVLAAHAPGVDSLCCAIDLSAATIGYALDHATAELALPRLVDAGAIPRAAGAGSRVRYADVTATLLRVDDGTVWLLADRTLEPYLGAWLDHALLERS